MKKRLKKLCEGNSKKSIFWFFLLRTLVIICMIREIFNGNISNALLCVFSLFLLTIPYTIEKKFKITLPTVLEISIFLFIFSAEILGEINSFYVTIPFWDVILHTINGFLCASVGFSLVYILNEKLNSINLSPLFVALVAFCFSMMIGAVWEIFEYGMDKIAKLDMQKDEQIEVIRSVALDPTKTNQVITIDGIDHTIVYDKDNKELVKFDGYLDIGINDTMEDLIVNFIGAIVFSIFGYLYISNSKKYKFAGNFMTRKKEWDD